MAIIWVIWQERNNRCFNDNSLAEDLLRDKVKFLAASWAFPLPSFKGISVEVILRDWKEVVSLLQPLLLAFKDGPPLPYRASS